MSKDAETQADTSTNISTYGHHIQATMQTQTTCVCRVFALLVLFAFVCAWCVLYLRLVFFVCFVFFCVVCSGCVFNYCLFGGGRVIQRNRKFAQHLPGV